MLKICRQLTTNQQFQEAVPLIATTAKHSPVTSISLVLVLVLRIVDVCRCHHFASDRYFLRVKKKILFWVTYVVTLYCVVLVSLWQSALHCKSSSSLFIGDAQREKLLLRREGRETQTACRKQTG